jgi:hypothetical protein
MIPIRFISEPIEVLFDSPPALSKKPGCPNAMIWQGQQFRIVEMLREWHDYTRRGSMASNMRPEHAEAATHRGSWGVGRDYYRVRIDSGRVFDLYYDRAPRYSGDRMGGWFLYRELSPEPPNR